eukprot:13056797-Alexandrium_andersonii.AAC.1
MTEQRVRPPRASPGAARALPSPCQCSAGLRGGARRATASPWGAVGWGRRPEELRGWSGKTRHALLL